ncbi:hypothetical protein M947_02225 [Sulfurimonas hongkongensis]|uniref:Uncharacterized protein n=1 Tax=Sulfurimonas hongkongensis TaxID=1172190 RepID=T0JRJ6_9BACT|nr:hypothetical protein [Sulfurimonas hongkongensis]EQB40646.1 hypothetical protein M947_02225 [Sulfurimonas hongkongensis]
MKKKTKHSFSSVISVNPYNESYFSGASSFLSQNNSPKYAKDQYAISYLNTKSFITSQISISKNISDEDLYDAINSKVYDELALDQAVSYKIQFIETFNSLDENDRNFHVFIVDPLEIEETFANVVSKIKYIDTIIPSPLLLKSLYEKEIVESNGVNAFIYFQENDASITIYNEQEFLYTKSINFSFLQMYERFCELYGERVLYEDFMDFLSNHNLKDTLSDYKDYFIKLYKEIFANISDILTYVKRAYELKKIEHIYIDSQVQTITKLDEMSEVELGVESSSYEFDYGLKSDNIYIDQLHSLMHIYATLPKEHKYNCNFTPYHRPPEFMQRESGKLVILSVASFIIAFLYPFTYWTLTYAQNLQYELLKAEYAELHNIKITREAIIKNKEADKAKVFALLKKQKDNYAEKKATLVKIHDVKVNYPMKAKLLSMFTKDLNKFRIKVDSITYKEDEDKNKKIFTLNLISKKDKKITQMVEYLTKVYEGKYDFFLRRIELKNDPNQYFSELKVVIL